MEIDVSVAEVIVNIISEGRVNESLKVKGAQLKKRAARWSLGITIDCREGTFEIQVRNRYILAKTLCHGYSYQQISAGWLILAHSQGRDAVIGRGKAACRGGHHQDLRRFNLWIVQRYIWSQPWTWYSLDVILNIWIWTKQSNCQSKLASVGTSMLNPWLSAWSKSTLDPSRLWKQVSLCSASILTKP